MKLFKKLFGITHTINKNENTSKVINGTFTLEEYDDLNTEYIIDSSDKNYEYVENEISGLIVNKSFDVSTA